MRGKIVRDKIPELLDSLDEPYQIHILGQLEKTIALREKIDEEIAEYDAAISMNDMINELADVIEVVYSLAESRGISSSEIDTARNDKAQKRGRFDRGIFLWTIPSKKPEGNDGAN